MDVKESYLVLELEIGASRAAVDDAYCRLIERWHPDRAAPAGPAAVREAQRMVQAINDAYHTLAKIAPNSTKPSASLRTSSAPASGAKPTLPPQPAGPPASRRPPSLMLPPPDTWAARSAPAASAPPPPAPAPAKSVAPPPTPAHVASAPEPPAPPVRSSLGEGGSKVEGPALSKVEGLIPLPKWFSDLRNKVAAYRRKVAPYYDLLFPLGSPRRRFGPVIVAAVVVFVLLLGKCAFSSSDNTSAAPPDPKKTGRLAVKSNRANATIEAARISPSGEASTPSVNGTIDQTLAGLTPGKYAVTARAEGWPDTRADVNVDAGRTTEVAINFKSGSLRLDSDPAGASVRLGEAVLGRTPLVIPQLPPGECQLFLEYPSWPAAAFKTTIIENVENTGTVRLPHGKLTVETTPPGATVLLGKRALGQTPLTLEYFPAGSRKVTLQAKDFPPLEVSVALEDGGEVKVSPQLGSGFPVLDPAALLRAVWVPDDPNKLSAPFDGISGPSAPRNGIVKNLHRKKLSDNWLRKSYRFSATVKSYDPAKGQVEFDEQKGELSRYRVLAKLSAEARSDQDLTAQLTKGATFSLYGHLSAVEEPRWPSKVITFEISSVEPLR